MAEEAGARLDFHCWIRAVGWDRTGRGKNAGCCSPNSWLSHRDLHSYLLGDHGDEDNQINNNLAGRHNNNRFPGFGEALHAAHQALLQQGGPVGFRPYHRPVHFPLKVCDFLFLKIEEKSLLVLELFAFVRSK